MKQLIGGRQRKIYTGPKGGTYYMKGGKKVYFKMKGGVSQPPSSLDPYVGKFYWNGKEVYNYNAKTTYQLKTYYYVHKLDEDDDKYLVYEMSQKAQHEKKNKKTLSILGRYHYIYAYENQKKFANELTFEETEMFKTNWKKIMENIDNNSFNTIDGQELKDLKTDLQLYGYRNDTENWKKLPWEVNIKSKPNVSKKANVTKKVETGYLYEGKKMTLIEFLEKTKLTTHLRNTNNSTLNQIKELLNEYKNPKNNSKNNKTILTELVPIFSGKEMPPKRLLRFAKNLTLISNNSPSPSPKPNVSNVSDVNNYGEFNNLHKTGVFNDWIPMNINGNKLTILRKIFNIEDLNCGDFGVVQLLTHKTKPDKQYVMKTQNLNLYNVQFRNEIRAYRDLSSLSFIPIVHYTFTYNGYGYIIMEKLDKLLPNPFLVRENIKDMLVEAYKHDWIIGLDLKSDNIMTSSHSTLKLIDFGEAVKKTDSNNRSKLSNIVKGQLIIANTDMPQLTNDFDKLHTIQMNMIGYRYVATNPSNKQYILNKGYSLSNLQFLN